MVADSLAALGSLWAGWMAPQQSAPVDPAPVEPRVRDSTTSDTPASTNAEQTSAQAQEQAQAAAAAAAAAASDLLSGAGKMWQSAVHDVSATIKATAQNVDGRALEEQVTVLRQKSGRLVEDMTRGVQSLNLNLPSGAEAIGASTRNLLDRAGQSLREGGREAMEIFVDADDTKTDGNVGNTAPAPWDAAALPEGERAYADALRREMLKIVVDAIYSKKKRIALFLSNAAERERFSWDAEKGAETARASLEADRNLRRLRAGLVPGKMKENEFWRMYFYHVHRLRQALIANNGVLPEGDGEGEDDEDPAVLFGEEDDELGAPTKEQAGETTVKAEAEADGKASETKDGKRNWDDEIDKIFEEDDE